MQKQFGQFLMYVFRNFASITYSMNSKGNCSTNFIIMSLKSYYYMKLITEHKIELKNIFIGMYAKFYKNTIYVEVTSQLLYFFTGYCCTAFNL